MFARGFRPFTYCTDAWLDHLQFNDSIGHIILKIIYDIYLRHRRVLINKINFNKKNKINCI